MTACAARKRLHDDALNSDDLATFSDASSLSALSRSPTPPSDSELFFKPYPSPLPSQRSSQESSPSPENMSSSGGARDEDGAPPAKKRRLHEPKARTTETLNLLVDDVEVHQKQQLDKLLKVLHKRRKIVVIAGAGISVSSGIPDFRSSTGLFRSLKGQHKLKSSGKDLFDASVYKDDKSTTQFHDMVRNLAKMTQSAKPSPFHHLLATLAQQDRLLRLYSQNVDGIDTQLPPLATLVPLNRKAPWPKTIQLHGNLEKMVCSKCRQMSDLDPELFDGPLPPLCQHCVENDDVRTKHAGKRSHGVGRLRPRMVLYNEHNPDDEAIGAVVKADLLKRPDALIVVGTSLKVPGVKRIVREMCGVVRGRKDGLTIWINNDPPPLVKEFEWDLIVKGPCDEVAHRACMRRWDEPAKIVGEPVTEEHVQRLQETSKPAVVIMSPSKSKTFERIQGVVTPVASPRLAPVNLQEQTVPQDTVVQVDVKLPPAKAGKKATTTKPRAPKAPKANGKRTTKKTAAAKATASNAKINQSFTVSKSFAQVQIPKPKQVEISADSFMANKTPADFCIPRTPAQQPMQPVSPSAVRNNSSPPFAPPAGKEGDSDNIEALKQRTKSLDTPREGKESPEERRRTISPTGPGPKGMSHILSWT